MINSLLREHVAKRVKRSPLWPKTRLAFIKANPVCANCGKHYRYLGRWFLCVHHIKPFHLFPELELIWENLISLCNNPRCHLDKGHLGDWRSWNENVVEDCKAWKTKYQNRPYKVTHDA